MGKLQLILIKSLLIIFFTTNVFAEGFKIDLRENNPTFQDQFDKFELNFDFKNNTSTRVVKIAKKYRRNISDFSEISMTFNIAKINDNGITLEMSYRKLLQWLHKTHLDDDFLVGSKWYNKKYKKLVNQSGGLDAPAKRVEFNVNDLSFTETDNPLSKKPKSYSESFVYDAEAIRKKGDADKFVKAAVFIVTVALIINHLDEINKIKEKSINTTSTTSSTGSAYNPVQGGYNPKWAQPGYTYSYGGSNAKQLSTYLKFRRF